MQHGLWEAALQRGETRLEHGGHNHPDDVSRCAKDKDCERAASALLQCWRNDEISKASRRLSGETKVCTDARANGCGKARQVRPKTALRSAKTCGQPTAL